LARLTGLTKGAGEESDEIERTVKGRTRISGDEVEIWICEAALPRTEEERTSAVRDLRLVNLFLSRQKLLTASA